MAAFSASARGARVTVLEKNDKSGKKIYITGKGRCNFTNVSPVEEYPEKIPTNPRFLYSALHGFTPEDAVHFFEESGCPVKVERGNRAFPVSDHASDITRALTSRCRENGVEFRYLSDVSGILMENNAVNGVRLRNGETIPAGAVILATGGLSYPSTGSSGDGYRMAAELGHTVTETQPSLVPFEIRETFCAELQGLSLKNVRLTMYEEGKKRAVYSEQGEMLFTHFGVSGPLVLSASAHYHKGKDTRLVVDLKPALTPEQLDARLIREFEENHARDFRNSLGALFPAKLIPVMAVCSGIPGDTKAGQISRGQRRLFGERIKAFTMTVTGTRGFPEAVITRGGVSVRQIDPQTMGSRLVDGLYFAGEIIDVDALTGGYNLQIAWSTGYRAGETAAGYVCRESAE